jgi:MscS family membrane protein
MPRTIVRLAFAILIITLVTSIVALSRAHLSGATNEKPYLVSLPDLSSPRATLQTLLTNGDVATREVVANGVPWLPTPAMLRMMSTVNVADVASASRDLEAALVSAQLKDVLDHIQLPSPADIPDAAMAKQQGITEWRLPGTPVVIAKATSGPQTGDFLFSPQTVAMIGDLSDALRDMPYRDSQAGSVYPQWRYMPGPLLPRASIAALPAPLRMELLGQALWQWIGLFVLLAAGIIAASEMIAWGIRQDARHDSMFHRYGQPVAALAVTGLSYFVLALISFGLKIWGSALEILSVCLELAAIFGIAWFSVTAILRAGELIIAAYGMRDAALDAQLVKVVSTLLSIGAGIGAGFFAASFIGVPVGPLVAGLGIGGLAVALAVRPTLENVIGGLTLFADRPARVGEYCRFGAESGTVEEIGLRTTKIRRTDDTVVTISNAELAQIRIENFSRRRKFLFNPLLRLRYDTTAAQLQEITNGILAMLKEHPKVLEESETVRLSGFGEYALELNVRAYVDATKNAEFVEVQEELNLGILDIVRRAGTNFAMPSRTNYFTRDVAVGGAASRAEEAATAGA